VTNAYREIGLLLLMKTKNDVIWGAGQLGKNAITLAKMRAPVCHPTK
jgi:hypothetical protein